MSTAMYAFDTLAFAKKLKNAGYTEAQAEALVEAHSQVFREMLESTLATKDDIKELKSDIAGVRSELKSDIAGVRSELKSDIAALDHKIDRVANKVTIRLGGMIVAGVAVLAAMRFFG